MIWDLFSAAPRGMSRGQRAKRLNAGFGMLNLFDFHMISLAFDFVCGVLRVV